MHPGRSQCRGSHIAPSLKNGPHGTGATAFRRLHPGHVEAPTSPGQRRPLLANRHAKSCIVIITWVMARRVERAEVLVVGGGIAGATAAIFARKRGHDVLLVDRGFFGSSGCTALASGMFSYFKPEDDLEHWLSNHGGTMVNQTLLAEALKLQYDLTHWLEEWGVEWVKRDGEIARMGGPGIPFPHSAMMAGGGPAFMMAIRSYALRIGVRVVNRTLVTDLLTSDGELPTAGRAVGALGINTRSGEPVVFAAQATVLATGPMHFPYPRPDSPFTGMPVELSGDGIAIALRAGVELGKMEIGGDGLVQALFHAAQGFEMLLGLGGTFYNARGEDFLTHYAETRLQGTGARRSVLGTAGTLELVSGRGPIMRDNAELSFDDLLLLDRVIPIIMRTFESAGIRVDQDRVSYLKAMVGSSAVSGAGIRINARGESSLPGLYGAGNTTDGAYVIMGQNISTCAVMGYWVGHSVTDYVVSSDPPLIDENQVDRIIAALLAPTRRTSGVSYSEVHAEVERVILDLGHIMSEDSLTHAIDRIEELQSDRFPLLTASDWHELAKIPGLQNFAQALKTAYIVMRHRKESRGNILRSDYPHTDNIDWLCMTVARYDGKQTVLHDIPRPHSEHYRKTKAERILHPFFTSMDFDT